MIIPSKILFSIKLFRYNLTLIKYPVQQIADLSTGEGHGKMAHGAYIQQQGDYLIAVNEKGEYIKAQRKLTLKDNVNEISTVVVEYPFAGIYKDELTN